MTRNMLKALCESIVEWKRRLADIMYDWESCALCAADSEAGGDACSACPLPNCGNNSPYVKAKRAYDFYVLHTGDTKAKAEWERTATNMIRCMERRLPKSAAKKKGK